MNTPPPGGSILFYDGVCGLCGRLVSFVLARDRQKRFHFASLQSRFAREILPRHRRDPASLDSLYLLTGFGTPAERVLARSRAVSRVLEGLPLPWRWVGALLTAIPAAPLNFAYDRIARIRYRFFGRFERCRVPRPEERERFVEFE